MVRQEFLDKEGLAKFWKLVKDNTTYPVATASANGLMSSTMFKAKMVKSIGTRQGAVYFEGSTITDHNVYITQNKNNITDSYTPIIGEGDVKIPNATTTYDGSMSHDDKRFLESLKNISGEDSVYDRTDNSMEIESAMEYGGHYEVHYWSLPMATTSLCGLMTGTDKKKIDGISSYAPKKVVMLQVTFNSNGTATINKGGGDFDITKDADIIASKYVEETSANGHYVINLSYNTATSSNPLINWFNNYFVKFSFMSKSTGGTSDFFVNLYSNFDGDILNIQCISTKTKYTDTFDCIWEFY